MLVIYRLPRGESLAFPASHCPACGQTIRAWDNLPVLSYLWLRGKARCCGASIPWRYPAVELLGGLWALSVTRVVLLDMPVSTPLWQIGALFCVYLGLGLGSLSAIFIDLEHMLLPDPITLGGALLGVLSAPLRDVDWSVSLVGAAVGFSVVWLPFIEIYRRVRGYPGMGLGDAKLLMLTGAWFGWVGVAFALMLGSCLGTITALTVYLVRGRLEEPESVTRERSELLAQLAELEGEEREQLERELSLDPLFAEPAPGLARARLAFGPFLAIATLAYLFVGPPLVAHYRALLSL
jgi:leader peptidase (prepilin peptidase)/N-methyltransferase